MSTTFSVLSALSRASRKLDSATICAFFPVLILGLLFTLIRYISKDLALAPLTVALIFSSQQVSSFILGLVKKYFGIERAKEKPISINLINKPLTFKIIVQSLLARLIILALFATPISLFFLLHIRTYTTILSGALIGYLLIRSAFIDYFIIDKNMTAFEALSASFVATRWQFWKLLGAVALAFLMLIATLLTAGIGGIWLIPLIQIFFAEIYLELAQPAHISPMYKPAQGLESEFYLG